MKVLVVGGGGREHALCWKLKQSPLLTELYCAPGNPGTAAVADNVDIADDEVHKLADFAADLKIDLTVVGPELSLSLGIADEFHNRGLALFGPRQQAAELESSKVFAKRFMERHGIPTAAFEVAHDAAEARAAAKRFGLPVVLKADGLAAGKGVLVVEDEGELEVGLRTLFEERRFGTASDRVVVEQFLPGEEVSFITLCDGRRLLPMATSKDYKRIGEQDTGPNTGGMGAHSPSGMLSSDEAATVIEKVLRPTAQGMADEGRPVRGVIYAGLMLTDSGPQVLEYNLRFGDPETQPLLMRLESDLLPVLAAGAAGDFGEHRLAFRKEAAACVVLASAGYPASPIKGEVIEGLDTAASHEGVEIFHAGTALRDGQVVTAGGRVLGVCAVAPRLEEALKRAYTATADIHWPNKVLRHDIGRRVLE
ncbi:MAG: phosphoribosylamine--glycine ligase [Acidobacteria bacterium]|nr:phosphoribosylamine--glycine ligase [Acidobacteriota bacterium]